MKARSLRFLCERMQIIQRARQQHLVQEFRNKTSALTPKLLDDVQSAWSIYVRSLNKGLSPNEQIEEGKENETWPLLVERVKDTNWKQECSKRHEKFDMQFTEAVRISLYIRHCWTYFVAIAKNIRSNRKSAKLFERR